MPQPGDRIHFCFRISGSRGRLELVQSSIGGLDSRLKPLSLCLLGIHGSSVTG